MRHGGKRKHALDVGLHDGGQVAHQQRQCAECGEHELPVALLQHQSTHQNAEGKQGGGDFGHGTDKGGNGSGRALIHIGYPHMEGHCAEFKRHGCYDEQHTQF